MSFLLGKQKSLVSQINTFSAKMPSRRCAIADVILRSWSLLNLGTGRRAVPAERCGDGVLFDGNGGCDFVAGVPFQRSLWEERSVLEITGLWDTAQAVCMLINFHGPCI